MVCICIIKFEFWIDEDMVEVLELVCLLVIGLFNYVDDEGYFNVNLKFIKVVVFFI